MVLALVRWLGVLMAIAFLVFALVAKRRPCDRAIVCAAQLVMGLAALALLGMLALAPRAVLDDPEALSHLRLVGVVAMLWIAREMVDAVRHLAKALKEPAAGPGSKP